MSEKSKFWYLKNVNIFEGMPDSEMDRIARLSSMKTAKKHQIIYFPDEPSSSIFFLKEGYVKISRVSEDGKEIILDIIGPGEVFGEMSLIDEGQSGRNEIAEAVVEVLICAINKRDFEEMVKKNPELNFQITKRIGAKLRKIEERVSEMAFKDVRRRLASFLIRYAEEFGKIQKGVISVKSFLSHQEIAFLIASARQTVTTELNELKSLGIIDFSHKTFIIKNMQKLKQIAK
jgi:CRP/FNR family transcriptional regulator